MEGHTALDLYNKTIYGTQPRSDRGLVDADLFTWGTNKWVLPLWPVMRILNSFLPRNATLGLGDAGDRVNPDHVIIQHKEASETAPTQSLDKRFSPIHVQQIQMSKLHTGARSALLS